MNYQISIFLICILLSACANTEIKSNTQTPHEKIQCQVFELVTDKDTLGTGFFYLQDGKIYALTASHVVLGSTKSTLYMRNACTQEMIAIRSSSKLAGIDLSILYPEKTFSTIGISANPLDLTFSTQIFGVSYPNLQSAEPRFKNKPIPTNGYLVDINASDILFTMNITMRGSSGSPIVTNDGRLVGVLTNRVLTDSYYSGVSYGISIKSIKNAITNNSNGLR